MLPLERIVSIDFGRARGPSKEKWSSSMPPWLTVTFRTVQDREKASRGVGIISPVGAPQLWRGVPVRGRGRTGSGMCADWHHCSVLISLTGITGLRVLRNKTDGISDSGKLIKKGRRTQKEEIIEFNPVCVCWTLVRVIKSRGYFLFILAAINICCPHV